MGQYLAIGIATNASIKKSDFTRTKLSSQMLGDLMREQFAFVPEIYDFFENDKFCSFELRKDILYSQLIAFLENVYPKLYYDPNPYQKVLDQLRILPQDQWIEWAKDGLDAFQFDLYAEAEWLSVPKSGHVGIEYKDVILSIEGKASMELYHRQFRFFKYCITNTFNQYSLAGAVRIFITG